MVPNYLETAGGQPATWHQREVVAHFGDVAAEYAALEQSCGVVLREGLSWVQLSGADRARLVHRLCTNAVESLKPGQGREAFLTDAKGRVLAHLAVLADADVLVLRAEAGRGATIAGHLDHYIIRDDVQIADRSAAWCELIVAGPAADAVWRRAVGEEPPAARLEHRRVPGAAAGRVVRWDAATLLLPATAEEAARLWERLRSAGARPAGIAAWDAWRIERGWPLDGVDFGPENLPQEIGRDAEAISFNKGCYLGQETVARLDARGHVNRRLCGLRFRGAEVPPAGGELQREGQAVGRVTSAAWSPGAGAAVALGFVRRGHDAPGTVLESAWGLAEVVAWPAPG